MLPGLAPAAFPRSTMAPATRGLAHRADESVALGNLDAAYQGLLGFLTRT